MFTGKRKVFGITLASAMLLAACGGGNTGGTADSGSTSEAPSTDTAISSSKETVSTEKVKLSFWDENAGPDRTPIWEELISRFEDENENITVEYFGLPKNDAKSKIDAAIAAKDTPDVASIQTSWLPEYSIREALYPLDDLFKDSDLNGKINQGAIDFNKEIVRDGGLYGIPYTQNLDIIWIREDLFKEAGIEAPETWDEFFKDVDEMTTDDVYGYTIRGGAGGSLQLQRLMYAYSGITDYVKEDGQATIDDPMHVDFLKKYFELYQKNTPQSDITNGYKEMVATFDTGKAAMVHHNIGSFGEHSKALEPDQFEAIPLPKSEKGNYVVEGGNTIGISLFAGTEHPEEAFKLAEFLNNAESQSYWNEKVGQIPTNSDVMDQAWIQDAQHLKVAFSVYDDPTTELYEPPFYLPDYRSILDNQVDAGIQSVMAGDMTVEEFLAEWAESIEASAAKYKDAFE
ncbi:sugar ABC transporter substrate-binding protein [Jeotgalibaca sp. MA1X17-3]|uniref:ABC transporter substrate-binding protein n=1 Tax=Jeotgalibaca sp. MA1X17-3 TaxID=2908211 RepID=UPI001F43D9F8|nr:sugar ABC transporter substrate-binding protein [Jeotgalibaca sp. MA1X17-3]UJF15657.1 sugar ABC transporter substrate-binding protein [Jeotgalibaca sp. MA1X17-3]